jgi:hypothetical protein
MDSDRQNKPPGSRPGWAFYRTGALDKHKPWRDRLAGFKVAINNMVSLCVAGAVFARHKPQKAEEMGRAVKSTAESTIDLAQEFCEMVKQDLVRNVEEQPPAEPGSSPTGHPADSLAGNYVPWHIREETFRSNIQVMLEYSVSSIEAVRLKPEGAEEAASKVTELANRTFALTKDFCAMVERDFVSKVEEQKAAKDRKAWRRASAYSPRPKGDGGGGWVYSRNGE